jgi:hypothetical protein
MKGTFGGMDNNNNKVTDKNEEVLCYLMICSGHCFEWSLDILPVCETVPSLAY